MKVRPEPYIAFKNVTKSFGGVTGGAMAPAGSGVVSADVRAGASVDDATAAEASAGSACGRRVGTGAIDVCRAFLPFSARYQQRRPVLASKR